MPHRDPILHAVATALGCDIKSAYDVVTDINSEGVYLQTYGSSADEYKRGFNEGRRAFEVELMQLIKPTGVSGVVQDACDRVMCRQRAPEPESPTLDQMREDISNWSERAPRILLDEEDAA